MAGGSSAQRLVWRGRLSFEGEDSRGHRIAISGDSAQEGAKPSDLLPLSLAACLAYDVVEVLRRKRQDLHGLEVVVDCEQEDTAPRRFTRISLRFETVGVIEVTAARRALELAEKNCPVLGTLAPSVAVETSITVASHS